MTLWLVNRSECDWDEYDGFVIRAFTADEARAIAMEQQPRAMPTSDGDYGPETWDVIEIEPVGDSGVVLASMVRG